MTDAANPSVLKTPEAARARARVAEAEVELQLRAVQQHARALRTRLRELPPAVTIVGGIAAGLVIARVLRGGGRRRGKLLMPLAMAAAAVEAHLMRAAKPWLARWQASLAERRAADERSAAAD